MVQIDFCTHILFQGNFAAQYFNSNSIPVFGCTWESWNQKGSGILSDIIVFEYFQLPCQCNTRNKLLLFLGRKVSAKESESD